MIIEEEIYKGCISLRKLPINIIDKELRLFEHELKREIPATSLLQFQDILVSEFGLLYNQNKILPECFVNLSELNRKK